MRPETLQCRLYLSAVLRRPLESPMWSKKKSDTTQTAGPEGTSLQTNQPPKPATASSEGTTKMNEDVDIDGTVEGLVHIDERKLTVGATAKLTADIIAGEVIVYGSVKGNVRGKGKVEIKKDGSVNGDLTTAQIIIEDGAFFKGSIEIEMSAEKEGDKNMFSRTASASAMSAAGAGPRSI